MVMFWLRPGVDGEAMFTPLYYEVHASLSQPMKLRGGEMPGILEIPVLAADQIENGRPVAGSGSDAIPLGRLHNTPYRQWLIVLEGGLRVGTGTGEVRLLRGGDLLLADDLIGSGHSIEADASSGRCLIMRIPLVDRELPPLEHPVDAGTQKEGVRAQQEGGTSSQAEPARVTATLHSGESSRRASNVPQPTDFTSHSWAPSPGQHRPSSPAPDAGGRVGLYAPTGAAAVPRHSRVGAPPHHQTAPPPQALTLSRGSGADTMSTTSGRGSTVGDEGDGAGTSWPIGVARHSLRSPSVQQRPPPPGQTYNPQATSSGSHARQMQPDGVEPGTPVSRPLGKVPSSSLRRTSPTPVRNGIDHSGHICLSGGTRPEATMLMQPVGSMPLGSQGVGGSAHGPGGIRLVARMSSLQGLKQNLPGCPNQDSHVIVDNLPNGRVMVAVFDGHGREGHRVSHRCSEFFAQQAESLGALDGQELSDELVRVFAMAHDVLEQEGSARWSGTTATVAIVSLVAGNAIVAHVGDSTLMISNGTSVEFVSRDHRIEGSEEQRISERGGEVRTAVISGVTARRVYLPGKSLPGLAMSRALGDVEAHSLGVLSFPDVKLVPFGPSSTLVVASDGVWDRFPPHQVADFLVRGQNQRASALASGIVNEARSRWPGPDDVDDITAIVVRAEQR